MSEAHLLTIHILAAVAEHEREMISQRTKEALKAAKACGVTFGSPEPKKGAAIHIQVIQDKADRFAAHILPVLYDLQTQGITGYRPCSQCSWHSDCERAAVVSHDGKESVATNPW